MEKLYPNSIEWIPRSKGGIVNEFNSKENYVVLKSGQKVFGDFFNLIPDQKASDLIFNSRLSSQDWCQINPVTFALKNHNNIHVVGDSINAWDMPKSAFSAYSQAKVCAENLKK